MSAPRAPRRWVRRAVLSALAGGGLTAGLGGPGAALGAEAPTGTAGTGEGSTPPVTTTSPQAPAAGQEGSGSSGTTTTTTTTTTSPAPAPAGTPGETSGTSTAPAGTSTTPAEAPGAPSAAPTVVVQHTQQVTAGRRTGASVTKGGAGAGQGGGSTPAGEGAAKPGPATVPPGTPNGVAPAPQAAGGEAAGLAALFSDSAVSAQALDFFRIPLFLLPIYKAAAFQYDVPWQVLAAINEVETDYGSDLSVSTAGAVGWMQFMPSTWLRYGVDATEAGYADPANPVDAIFAAARYLHAAGASHSLDAAILAYNHSQEYVESVLLRARLIASFPRSVIGTLTGLVDGRAPTLGARVAPGVSGLGVALGAGGVAGAATTGTGAEAGTPSPSGSSSATAGALPLGTAPTPADAAATAPTPGAATAPTPADAGANAGAGTPSATSPTGTPAGGAAHAESGASAAAATPGFKPPPPPQVTARRAEAKANAPAKPSQLVELLGAPNAPVRAVESGRIEHLGHSHSLGRYLVLRDVYGDVFTYAGLGSIAPRYRPAVSSVEHRIKASRDPAPTQAATAGHQVPLTLKVRHHAAPAPLPSATSEAEGETAPAGMGRVRLYAHPGNPVARAAAASAAKSAGTGNGRWLPLRSGSVVSEGTVLGRLDTPAGASAGRLRFAVRPAGDSATIDPQPLLENWRQLGAALHPKGSRGTSALLGATAGDALLMSKAELELAVLSDPGIQLDACGRRDVASGAVDGRVLAALEFLSRSGLQPTVAALRCPRGGVSPSGLSVAPSAYAAAARAAHDRGTAVEITAINGVLIAGHQGEGTVTAAAIRTLLTLSGRFAPHRIVSLMQFPEASTTQALPSAWDHLYIDFLPRPSAHATRARAAASSPLTVTGSLSGGQWSQLIGRIAVLPKPTVAAGPSSTAIRDPQAAPTNRELGAHG